MRQQFWFLAAGFLLGVAFVGVARSQDAKDGEKNGGAMQDPAAAEAWMKSMTPGEQHARLAAQEGAWDVSGQCVWSPTEPPAQFRGSSTFRMVLGGRYQVQEYKGEFMGMPFEGMGIRGYDNVTKKHFSVVFDSMRTGIWVTEGDADEKGVVTSSGPVSVPAGGTQVMRQRITQKDGDHLLVETFGPDAKSGKDAKVIELDYTRRKSK